QGRVCDQKCVRIVVAMKGVGHVTQIMGECVGGVFVGAGCDYFTVARQRRDQALLVFGGQQRQVGGGQRELSAFLRQLPVDAAHARMGVLNVVNGVVVGLRLGQLQ